MARIAMARRMLALSCLFLAIAPFQSAAGQEAAQEVAQEIDNLELDEVVNEVADSIGGNEVGVVNSRGAYRHTRSRDAADVGFPFPS